MKTTFEAELLSDVELVERSRGGDREAFGSIVERYQSLVCALTYSACGNLHASEDLAQVTFITAWCQLRNLQEPGKLKSWLCGIARNVANNSFRQDKRAPTVRAEGLDSVSEISSVAPSPREQVISREEEAILWRSLGELPPTYREPLVLFYRQHQSVAEVAGALELSEDAVKQRLSRGRAMLTEQVTAFVEGALRQTTPGSGFTVGVLAALPKVATSAKVATVGAAAAKGTTVAKSAAGLAVGGMWGMLGSMGFSLLANIENTKSPREREFMIGMTWVSMVVTIVCVILGFALYEMIHNLNWVAHDVTLAALVFALAVYGVVMSEYKNRRRKQIQIEDGTWVATDWTAQGKRDGLSLDPSGGGSKANAYTSIAFIIAAIVIVAQAFYFIAKGLWILGLLNLCTCGAVYFWRMRGWRRQPRFDARLSTLARYVGLCGFFTLVFYNLHILQRPVSVADAGTIIGFNLGVVVAYGMLLTMLVWYFERADRLPSKLGNNLK